MNSALDELGLNQDEIDKFLPQVTDYFSEHGGDAAKKALISVLQEAFGVVAVGLEA